MVKRPWWMQKCGLVTQESRQMAHSEAQCHSAHSPEVAGSQPHVGSCPAAVHLQQATEAVAPAAVSQIGGHLLLGGDIAAGCACRGVAELVCCRCGICSHTCMSQQSLCTGAHTYRSSQAIHREAGEGEREKGKHSHNGRDELGKAAAKNM